MAMDGIARKIAASALKIASENGNSEAKSYTIIKTSDDNYNSSYRLKENSPIGEKFVGDIINVPKGMFIESGDVKTCIENDVPVIGYKIDDKYIDLTIANAVNQHVYILVTDLINCINDAQYITYSNLNSGLTSTNIQNAIDEIKMLTEDNKTFFDTRFNFPSEGEIDKLYVAINENMVYRYDTIQKRYEALNEVKYDIIQSIL